MAMQAHYGRKSEKRYCIVAFIPSLLNIMETLTKPLAKKRGIHWEKNLNNAPMIVTILVSWL